MKHLFTLVILISFYSASGQKHSLVLLWSTDSVIATPESVLPDPKNKTLYMSLIDGGPWDADGKGGVGKMSTAGNNYDSNWITGLNAPKGMGIFRDKLYAADLSDIVIVDIPKAKIIKKISIDGASGLNDITVSDKGIIYVSDSKTGKIWKVDGDKTSLYLDSVTGANGLKAVKDDLYFAKGPVLMKSDAAKHLSVVGDVGQGIDGIEPIGNGDFLVSSWSGYIFYLYANGSHELLLDTHEQKKNTADIGYDPEKKIVYVPTFFDRKIMAYQLK